MPRPRTPGTHRATGALAAALLLGACSGAPGTAPSTGPSSSPSANGVAAMPAPEVLAAAAAAAQAAPSVHVTGTASCPQGPVTLDLRLRHDGGATGAISFGTGRLDVIATSDALYIKAPRDFWASQTTAAKAATIGGRWVSLARPGNPCLSALTSIPALVSNYVDLPGTPSKEPSGIVDGTAAQLVSVPPGHAVWVATDGDAVPVRTSQPSSGTRVSWTEWGAPVDVAVPAATDVIDGSTLAGG